MIMKNHVTNEISDKVYHLMQALSQAKTIVAKLEKETLSLKDVLNNLTSKSK